MKEFFESFSQHLESFVTLDKSVVYANSFLKANIPEFENLKCYNFPLSQNFECKLSAEKVVSSTKSHKFVIRFCNYSRPSCEANIAWVIQQEDNNNYIKFGVSARNSILSYQRVKNWNDFENNTDVQQYLYGDTPADSLYGSYKYISFYKKFMNSRELLSEINFDLIRNLFCIKEKDQETIDTIKMIFNPLVLSKNMKNARNVVAH